MENLKRLKEYVFHDIDINQININIEEKILKLSIFEFVENIKDYKIVEFTFNNITNLRIEECLFNSDSILEIYSSELTENEDDIFHISFNLINGFYQPASSLSFKFQQVIINS